MRGRVDTSLNNRNNYSLVYSAIGTYHDWQQTPFEWIAEVFRTIRKECNPSTTEDTMDKVWMYVAGIIVGAALLIYLALAIVKSTNPPAY